VNTVAGLVGQKVKRPSFSIGDRLPHFFLSGLAQHYFLITILVFRVPALLCELYGWHHCYGRVRPAAPAGGHLQEISALATRGCKISCRAVCALFLLFFFILAKTYNTIS
jgi:hypothetical protein